MHQTGSKKPFIMGVKSYRNKSFLRDRCPYELGMLMKRPNCSKVRWDFKGFVAFLDVTPLDSLGKLVIGYRTFSLNIMSWF
jgi:hypothetical protein